MVYSRLVELLNALLHHEAEGFVNAEKYECPGECKGYRSGHYNHNIQTTAGDITLKVPKLKGVPFETAIIERYRRRECSVEEALIENVSCRCICAACERYHRSTQGYQGIS